MRRKQEPILSRATTGRKLADLLDQRVGTFVEKKRRYEREISAELAELLQAYTPDIVQPAITRFEQTFSLNGEHVEVSAVRRCRRGGDETPAEGKGLTIKALKPHVEEHLQSVHGQQFHAPGVSRALKEKGLNFNTSYVSWLLRHMEGLTNLGRQKLEGFMGPPTSIYIHSDVESRPKKGRKKRGA